ncbi:hypothetical protein EJ08DRAFT_677383 [Tothia fuscella]|uniref:Uncharacterized protein n=1 Tax=Tothia fuscella TaxID=1048955 RepID=A0A9P4NV16_9PEZI|nr:hypothetical protein EJ08DRAFT_677383 [Tothia fuscella]
MKFSPSTNHVLGIVHTMAAMRASTLVVIGVAVGLHIAGQRMLPNWSVLANPLKITETERRRETTNQTGPFTTDQSTDRPSLAQTRPDRTYLPGMWQFSHHRHDG